MIARITGVLEEIDGAAALLRVEGSGLTYEVLLPAYTAARLVMSVGTPITLHTRHFIESQGQGTTMIPRLAGFATVEDRDFYELFTTCKGIGNKRALRAMALETAQIAAAIADRDLATLQSLPEVGRRTAETIVATLRGKVDHFVTAAAYQAAATPGDGKPAGAGQRGIAREALEALLALGEPRIQAMAWIDQALHHSEAPSTVEALIARVYQIKGGG